MVTFFADAQGDDLPHLSNSSGDARTPVSIPAIKKGLYLIFLTDGSLLFDLYFSDRWQSQSGTQKHDEQIHLKRTQTAKASQGIFKLELFNIRSRHISMTCLGTPRVLQYSRLRDWS